MYTWELIENRPDWISQWNFRIWRYLKCSSQLRIYALNFCKFVWSANKWKNVLTDKKKMQTTIFVCQFKMIIMLYIICFWWGFFWGGGLFCFVLVIILIYLYMYQLTMTQFVMRIFEVSNISTLWINTFHVSNFCADFAYSVLAYKKSFSGECSCSNYPSFGLTFMKVVQGDRQLAYMYNFWYLQCGFFSI